jgi:hypothetical protein
MTNPESMTVEDILALSADEYAALVWSVGGHRAKTLLFDAGLHDADAPGGHLTPACPKE